MPQGRNSFFIIFLTILIIPVSFLYAQPKFFGKELKNIPPLDDGFISRLCGGENNWDCYFDTFYELWGIVEGQEQIILDAKTMYQMDMYPYGVKDNEFYLLDDDRTLLIKTAGVWRWQTSHRLILYDIIDKTINEANNYFYVYDFIERCKNDTYPNTKIFSTKYYRSLSEGGGWNGDETMHLVSLDNKTYIGGGRDKLDFDGFIYMPAIQDYENFILENECVLYEEIKWKQ